MSNTDKQNNIDNMSNITDWIKDELYPSLFESIDIAFPEHKFQRFTGGWRSKTYLSGASHKDRVDKTVINRRAPGYILEQGGDVFTLVDYVMRRDGAEFIQAVETLARVAGLQVPKSSSFDPESYQRQRDQATILENARGAEGVRSYLSSRGYSAEEVEAMGLGYIPSQELLFKHLLSKGYSQTQIEEAVRIKTDTRIGDTHKLTIPYRSGGYIKGFKFRTVGGSVPKYINSQGLDKIGGFFNLSPLRGEKDLVIVEGELDALHATARGVDNVVALGGSSISPEQIKDAKKRGARMFTICLDTEPGKEADTVTTVNRVISVIREEGVNRVYIVTLPALDGDKTDPDRLIKESGAEAFKEAIAGALPWYEYRLQAILHKYDKEELQPKDIDSLLEEVVEVASQIPEPTERDRYKKLFTSLDAITALGITGESLTITIDRLTSTKAKESQNRELSSLLSDIRDLQGRGETEEALALLDKRARDIKAITATGLLPPPQSFETLLEAISTIPPAYRTGYRSLDEFIGFTPGAISLIAGRPSHGKTTLLFNLLLGMSETYPEQSFYFFTYEEPVKNLSIKLLNRLTATDLSGYFRDTRELAKPTNYEFIKSYIRAGRTDIEALETGKRRLQGLVDSQRIKIIDRNYSVEELYRLITYLLGKGERIGGIFIDYIQRMRTERKTQDKRTEIAHISDQVLQIAKDSGLPIILGAQLNRDAKERPRLEHLKEAGNLEEDANTVISVYCQAREEEEATQTDESPHQERVVTLELKTLKNREGEVNRTETLDWDRWTGLLTDRESRGYFNK
jgi:DNA primase